MADDRRSSRRAAPKAEEGPRKGHHHREKEQGEEQQQQEQEQVQEQEQEQQQQQQQEQDRGWSHVRLGGTLTRCGAVFSADETRLLCCSGDVVKVVSATTGERVSLLSGHTATITAVARHPFAPDQVLTASLDGTVRGWSVSESRLLRTWMVGGPVTHLAVPLGARSGGEPQQQQQQEELSHVYVAVATKGRPGDAMGSAEVVRFHLSTSESDTLYKARGLRGLVVSPRGDYVVSVAGSALYCWSVRRSELVRHRHARPLTTVAFHPGEPFLATGDSEGRIVLWHNFALVDSSKVVTSSLHWHAHAVRALAFTDDGAYMLSGGEESALVLWQLQSEHRQFLPRLGAPIGSIDVSPSGRMLALSCDDNAVRLVDAISSRLALVVRGLQVGPPAPPGRGGREVFRECPVLAFEPRRRALVVPGAPGHLQFFDAARDRHVADLEVVPRNLVSRIDRERQSPTRVELVAFSRGGTWMATVEGRPRTESHLARSTLKLWRHDPAVQQFVLRSRVNQPHSGRLTALAFHPHRDVLLTASTDATFKMWALRTEAVDPTPAQQHQQRQQQQQQKSTPKRDASDAVQELSRTRHSWFCQSVGSYRDAPAGDAAFSPDGSLVAAAFGPVVALFDPASLVLRHTLVYPGGTEPVIRLRFVHESPYLVVATARAVYTWNLLTLSLWWSYALPVGDLAVDPLARRFCVAVVRDREHEPVVPLGGGGGGGGGGDPDADNAQEQPLADDDDEEEEEEEGDPEEEDKKKKKKKEKGGKAAKNSAVDSRKAVAGSGSGKVGASVVQQPGGFVAMSASSYLLVFDAESPVPVAALPAPDLMVATDHARSRATASLAFVAPADGRLSSSLVYVTDDRSLCRVDPVEVAGVAIGPEETRETEPEEEAAPRSPRASVRRPGTAAAAAGDRAVSALLSASAAEHRSPASAVRPSAPVGLSVDQLYAGPSHLAASMDSVMGAFMGAAVGRDSTVAGTEALGGGGHGSATSQRSSSATGAAAAAGTTTATEGAADPRGDEARERAGGREGRGGGLPQASKKRKRDEGLLARALAVPGAGSVGHGPHHPNAQPQQNGDAARGDGAAGNWHSLASFVLGAGPSSVDVPDSDEEAPDKQRDESQTAADPVANSRRGSASSKSRRERPDPVSQESGSIPNSHRTSTPGAKRKKSGSAVTFGEK